MDDSWDVKRQELEQEVETAVQRLLDHTGAEGLIANRVIVIAFRPIFSMSVYGSTPLP